MRCLFCNKEILNPNDYERSVSWHAKCLKRFFGVSMLPEIDLSEKALEQLADQTICKGLTVPGVQKKLSLHLDKAGRSSRLTIVDYPTGYILKPQSKDYPFLPEAEFLSMKLAEIAGIQTVPNALLQLQNRYAYITKRIDRNGDQTYAMEDFCQLSGRLTADKYRSSYENCGKVIKAYSRNVGLDLTEFYYRLLFCFCTGNSDMHLKNFSLIEDSPGSRRFSLSAAYDLLPVNIIMPADREQMALTLNGKKRNIKRKDFLILAENMGISEKASIGLMKQIVKYRKAFLDEVEASYVPQEMKEQLHALIQKRMEALEGFSENI